MEILPGTEPMQERLRMAGIEKAEDGLELYIHIPFCVKKCDYCDFLSGPASQARQKAYIRAVLTEIQNLGNIRERPVDTLFIGGGTPSVLEPGLMEELLAELSRSFRISTEAEFTIEANPGTLTPEKLALYRQYGINRISIGLQSPKNRELVSLGRIHSYEQFLESFHLARKSGFSNINVDLMCAIPGQTREGWAENLRTTASLGPEHISAYSLIVEEGTPFAKRSLALPDEDTEYQMYEDTADILAGYGYGQYEISNYAREGCACRHNIGYWQRRDYLGIGLGAASLLENQRFSNTRDMEKYLKKSRCPGELREEVQFLGKEDEMAEFMFLGLRMTRGVRKTEFRKNFGMPIESVYGKTIEKYKRLELLKEQEDRIFLTRRGIHVSNVVMADFLPEG